MGYLLRAILLSLGVSLVIWYIPWSDMIDGNVITVPFSSFLKILFSLFVLFAGLFLRDFVNIVSALNPMQIFRAIIEGLRDMNRKDEEHIRRKFKK